MSPEQAQGHTAGPASDIFSLGAVLGFAATGRGPFGSGDTAGLLYRVVHGKPDLSQVPGKLRPLLRRSLANAYWPAPYPGDTVITQRADAKCSEALAAYAGVPDTHSKYGWDNIFPDATDWSHGGRQLVCVAFHPTPSTPGGTPISGSIKGSRR